MNISQILAEGNLDDVLDNVNDYSFVIMYPRHRHRRALMALALSDKKRHIYYYPLQAHHTTLAGWLTDFVEDAQFPKDFGQNTIAALGQRGVLPEELAEGLGADLKTLRKSKYTLIIDELDRLTEDLANIETFFKELSSYMPKQAQIMVDGRQLRRQPWHELKASGDALIIGDENAVGGGFFSPEDVQRGQVEFLALSGNPRIVSDGRTIRSWDGSLPRNLCYYFIERQMVTRQQIFDAFWPHLGIKEATNVFHVTKRKISEKVGYDITSYSNGFYVPSQDVDVMYDAREFERLIEETLENPDDTNPANWYRAVQIYRHPYLQGLDMDWVVEKRQKLKEGYVSALIGLGRYHWALDESNHALGYFQRSIAEQPNREDVHRNIMQLYHEAGDIDSIVTQYEMLESLMRREYDIPPSRETRELFTALTSIEVD